MEERQKVEKRPCNRGPRGRKRKEANKEKRTGEKLERGKKTVGRAEKTGE